MSVETTNIVMMGYKFAFDTFTEEQRNKIYELDLELSYENYLKENNSIVCIVDGMNGEYIMIGLVLAMSKEDEDSNELPFKEFSIPREDVVASLCRRVLTKIECPQESVSGWPQMFAFCHYS